MLNIQQRIVADSIEQAAKILETAYTLIVSETDVKTLKVRDGVLDNMDHQTTLKHLSKIAIMCRRLELEVKDQCNQMSP